YLRAQLTQLGADLRQPRLQRATQSVRRVPRHLGDRLEHRLLRHLLKALESSREILHKLPGGRRQLVQSLLDFLRVTASERRERVTDPLHAQFQGSEGGRDRKSTRLNSSHVKI